MRDINIHYNTIRVFYNSLHSAYELKSSVRDNCHLLDPQFTWWRVIYDLHVSSDERECFCMKKAMFPTFTDIVMGTALKRGMDFLNIDPNRGTLA